MESIISFCRKINALIVAEGTETEAELATLIRMKVDLAQGYFLAGPAIHPQPCYIQAKRCIQNQRNDHPAAKYDRITRSNIGSLISRVSSIDVDASVKAAIDISIN